MDSRKLAEWRMRKKLLVALFDLDDTLIKTSLLFNQQIQRFIEQCMRYLPGQNFEDVLHLLEETSDAAFLSHKVSPKRWLYIVRVMANKLNLGENSVLEQHLYILLEIYSIIPELQDGALETLHCFQDAGFKLGLVTHANKEWTQSKLQWLGLELTFQSVTIAHEDEFKGWQDWDRAVKSLGVSPKHVVAVGDSVQGDILAAKQAGVEKLVLVPTYWQVYKAGEVPEEVIRAEGIGNVVDALLKTW